MGGSFFFKRRHSKPSITFQPMDYIIAPAPSRSAAAAPSISGNSNPLSSAPEDFPCDGVPPSYLRNLIDSHGGESEFEGSTTSDFKRTVIVPKTHATRMSLCAQMRQEGDARIQPATWFVSHPWQMKLLDLVRALESFFADKPDAIIWLDFISTSQHQFAPSDRPPEWWQHTFRLAIGQMGQMVMVMTPWENPVALTRAWCLYELYACRSSGSRFSVAFPPCERARFIAEIVESGDAFYDMLSKVNTANSECSRETDRQRIFSAVQGLAGGFSALDRGVLSTMTEWLQLQLEERMQQATRDGHERDACSAQHALAVLFEKKTEYDRAHVLFEQCFAARRALLGADHPDTLASLHELAGSFSNKLDHDRALLLAQDCLARRTQVLGEMHPDTLSSILGLARIHVEQWQFDRARQLHEE